MAANAPAPSMALMRRVTSRMPASERWLRSSRMRLSVSGCLVSLEMGGDSDLGAYGTVGQSEIPEGTDFSVTRSGWGTRSAKTDPASTEGN